MPATLLLFCLAAPAQAGAPPRLALIMDDLGEQRLASQRALRLPPPVAFSFLPAGVHSAGMAESAGRRGHEILLHLPLEPLNGAVAAHDMLETGASSAHIASQLAGALARVPGAVGINHHQGSRFTASHSAVDALMRAVSQRPSLYYIDSRTTPHSVAEHVARKHGVASTRRHVFIDSERGEAAVRDGWRRWLEHARRHGAALAIAHPYPETLQLLEEELPGLHDRGYQLVAPSALLRQSNADGHISVRATSTTAPPPRQATP